ncbi:MAG TPA: hypothetical protein H9694_10625 [Firmicutes bacterium]|nr:hypothetical protein [Bacillota bacterium]
MTAKKKKMLTAVGAVAMAAVVGVGGTFAWQSISQTALNEAAATLNPGGRLHDDFDGRNKDVYVENFTDVADGTPIFARVRLDEYMEIGLGAGTDRDLPSDEPLTVTNLTVVGQGAKINDKTTWTTRTPTSGLADEDGEIYWAWDTEGGQTVYMPTFNKNKDSLQADVNGTYDGDGSGTPYNDYQTYTENQQVTADATYDDDSNDVEDDGTRTENETHTAANTINGTVITMEEWLTRWETYQALVEGDTEPDAAAEQAQVMGDFWVWDDDGWAYWANAIEPSTATGLLLDGIELINPPSDNYYYGINVVGQFVTADDIGYLNGTGFYDTTNGKDTIPSENAEALIELLTGQDISLTRVVLESEDGATTVEKSDSLLFRASVTRNGVPVETTEDDFAWSVSGNTTNATTFYTGWGGYYKELWVDKTEAAETLTVTATYTDAAGEEVSGSMRITVTTPPAKVSLSAGSTTVYQNGTTNLSAAVRDGLTNSPIGGAAVSWSVTGQASDDTKVDSTGNLTATLTVGRDETADNRLTVTASYYDPNVGQTVTATQRITVQEAWQSQIANITAGDTSTLVNIDGIDWKVLAKDGDTALIWAAEPVGQTPYDTASSFNAGDETSVWRDSEIRTWLQNWLEDETTILKTVAQETTLYTRDSSKEIGNGTTKPVADCPDVMASSDEWIETTDKVFLLSEADLFGTYNGEKADARDYTYNGTQLTPNRSQRMFDKSGWPYGSYAWLRNAYSNSDRHYYQPNTPVASTDRWLYMAGVRYDGYTTTYTTTTGFPDSYVTQDENYVLPALWIDFSMD